MRTLFRLAKLIDGAADNHFPPMLEEMMQNLFEVKDLRAIIEQRQHDHAERRFELGVLIEVVEDDERDLVALAINDDPDPFPVGSFVAEIADALDAVL